MLDPIEYDSAFTVAPEGEERERFVVQDDSQAAWAMRKLMALRKRQADIDALAEEEAARIGSWHLHASSGLVADTNYFTGILTEYARKQRDDFDRKSISLPYGTVKSRASSRRVEVTDADAFIAWARTNAPTLIRVKEEPDKAAIKASFDSSSNLIVDPSTGEVVPGVAVAVSDTTFTIETN